MILRIFVIIMTLLLPISIYRAVKEYKIEHSISVNIFGHGKKYTGSKAKIILYINILFQLIVLFGIYILLWDYLNIKF